MKVLMSNDGIEKVSQLWYLKQQFSDYFEDRVEGDLYCIAYDRLMDYAIKVATPEEQQYLENFAKAYFEMEKNIVARRNRLTEIIHSDKFKKQKLINKMRGWRQLKDAQNLCDDATEFEKEFDSRVNISLLRVENERWAREKTEEQKLAL